VTVQDAGPFCELFVEVCLHGNKVHKAPPELIDVNCGDGTEYFRNRTAGIVRSADATQVGSIGTKASALSERGVDGPGNVADRRLLRNEWQQQHAEKEAFQTNSSAVGCKPIERSTKTDDPFDFLVPQRQVSSETVGVLELGVTGHLMVSGGTRVGFGGLDERSPDASPLQGRFHVPALDEWHW
jgi:hypothetical protein